jgi:hypothetical protein
MGFKTSIFSFVSGKFYLLKYLLPFPEHKIYIEAFAGSGVVLLNKKPCRVEVYNDINKDFVNFWLVLRDYNFFLRLFCEMLPDSRQVFTDFKNGTIDDKYILSIYGSFIDSILARAIEEASTDEEVLDITKKFKELKGSNDVISTMEFLFNIHHSFQHRMETFDGIPLNKANRNDLPLNANRYIPATNNISSLKDAFSFFYNMHHSFAGTKGYDGIHYERKDRNNLPRSDWNLANANTYAPATDEISSLKDALSFFYRMHHSFSYKGDAFNGISLTHEDARNKIREAFVEKMKDDPTFEGQLQDFRNFFTNTTLECKAIQPTCQKSAGCGIASRTCISSVKTSGSYYRVLIEKACSFILIHLISNLQIYVLTVLMLRITRHYEIS